MNEIFRKTKDEHFCSSVQNKFNEIEKCNNTDYMSTGSILFWIMNSHSAFMNSIKFSLLVIYWLQRKLGLIWPITEKLKAKICRRNMVLNHTIHNLEILVWNFQEFCKTIFYKIVYYHIVMIHWGIKEIIINTKRTWCVKVWRIALNMFSWNLKA